MFADPGPVTTLEQFYVKVIAGAAWRLRRCSQVEGELADYRDQGPLFDEKAEKIIRPLERAGASAHALVTVPSTSSAPKTNLQLSRSNPRKPELCSHTAPPDQPASPLAAKPRSLYSCSWDPAFGALSPRCCSSAVRPGASPLRLFSPAPPEKAAERSPRPTPALPVENLPKLTSASCRA